MEFDYLVAEVRQEATAKANHVLNEARKNAKHLSLEAKKEADLILAGEKARALEEAEARSSIVSGARLKAKQVVTEARNKLVEEAVEDLRRELLEFAKSREYKAVFSKLAKQAVSVMKRDCDLLVAKRDLALAKSLGYNAKPFDMLGGAIASSKDGLIRVNNSFEALLEERNDAVRQKAFEELFGKKGK